MTDRAYPVGRPGGNGRDPRFSIMLALDVAWQLERRGYPHLTNDDLADLQHSLWRFIYGEERSW